MAQGLIEPVTLCFPELPQQIEGLTIAHLTDLHIRRFRGKYRRLAQVLEGLQVDVAAWTGDYMCLRGDEPRSLEVMQRLCERFRPRLGMYGVFGNHDTPKLREMFEKTLPIRWLNNASVRADDLPLWICGFYRDRHSGPDTLAALEELWTHVGSGGFIGQGSDPATRQGERPLRVLLCHEPTGLLSAADLGMDLMLCGHTHGGQIRLGRRGVVFNSSDLPLGLTSGVLRHKNTVCVVSRGLGEIWVPMRLFCKNHLPVYTLRRGPRPGRWTAKIENVIPW